MQNKIKKIYCEALPPLNITTDNLVDNCLKDISFHRAILSEFQIGNSSFENCNFRGAYLFGTKIINSKFYNCNFRGCRCNYMYLEDCLFENCHFDVAELININCKNAMFENCSFDNSELYASNFNNAIFKDCTMSYASYDKNTLFNYNGVNLDACIIKGVSDYEKYEELIKESIKIEEYSKQYFKSKID